MTDTDLFHLVIDSPLGELTLVGSDAGLRAVLWPDDEGRVKLPDSTEAPDHPVLVATRTQLGEYFTGERTEFELPMDLHGTEFQVQVWTALADIPYGETISYGEQAKRIGRPKAVRAVGAANGKNPLSIVLPCHRVVGSTGALTGFASGIDAKAALLDHEVRVRAAS